MLIYTLTKAKDGIDARLQTFFPILFFYETTNERPYTGSKPAVIVPYQTRSCQSP
jgi:hypothetical protein